MQGNKERLTIAIKPETLQGVRQLAYLNGQSLSEYVDDTLAFVVEKHMSILSEFSAAENTARQSMKESTNKIL